MLTRVMGFRQRNVWLHLSLRSYPEGLEATRQVEKVITASHAAGVQGKLELIGRVE